jgi:UDPglucose 6-dehydrogenase
MRIAMIGTGYVGLVSGACFADFGHHVCCVDKDSGKIDGLNAGKMPIWEPGLEALVKANAERGRLTFTTDLEAGVAGAEAIFIAVGTPARRGDGHADLTFVFEAVRELAKVIRPGTVVVTKSTVPVGTGDRISEILAEEGAEGISVASNPEFLREGAAIRDFKIPDRIVVGAEDEKAREVLREIYRPLFLNQAPILFTGRRTAELTKYAANAFLATKISFINEIANVSEEVGADVTEVARGMGLDTRIGPKFLQAGIGYGGSCFPKDVTALKQLAGNSGYHFQLLNAVIEVNELQKRRVIGKLKKHLGDSLVGKKIALLGLSFKPNTDDMREASSLVLSARLRGEGAIVSAFDPVAANAAADLLPGVEIEDSPLAALEGADAAVIVTEWPEFAELDLAQVRETMRTPLVIDGRNLLDGNVVAAAGFAYEGVGRPATGSLDDVPAPAALSASAE